jgi:hypothetical protein
MTAKVEQQQQQHNKDIKIVLQLQLLAKPCL